MKPSLRNKVLPNPSSLLPPMNIYFDGDLPNERRNLLNILATGDDMVIQSLTQIANKQRASESQEYLIIDYHN